MVGLFIIMIYNFYTVGNMRREARKEDKLGLEAYITAPGGLRYSIPTVALGWVDSRCIVSSFSRRNGNAGWEESSANPGRAVCVRRHFRTIR